MKDDKIVNNFFGILKLKDKEKKIKTIINIYVKVIDILKNPKIAKQILLVLLPFVLFSIAATVSKESDKSNMWHVIAWNCIVIIPFLSILYYFRKKFTHNLIEESREWIKKNKLLLIIVFIALIMRSFQIGTIPRWDSEAYYYPLTVGCSNFSFTLSSYISNFRLASHPSLGYSLFIAIGEYITPYNIVGVNCINLILYGFAIAFIYKILQFYLPTKDEKWIAVGTLLITFEPMLLGTFSHLNLDYPLFIFSIYIFYMHIKKQYILFFYFSFMLTQSKETGIVILAGYIFTYFLAKCIKNRKIFKNIKDPVILGSIVVGVLMIVYQVYVQVQIKGAIWGNGIKIGNDELQIKNNYFSINIKYICLKLKTIFLMNCSWLSITLIVIFGIINYIKSIVTKKWDILPEFYAYIGSILILILFNCVYVTYNNPRYNLAIEQGMVLVAVYLLLKTVNSIYIKIYVTVLTSLWFVAESYTTIDPVSLKLFPKIETGKYTNIIHPVWDNNPYLADTSVYNNQSDYLDKAYNKVLRSVDYDEQTDILILGEYEHGVRAIYLEGRYMTYYWDAEAKVRTLKESKDTFPINTYNDETFRKKSESGQLNSKAVAIFTPQYKVDEQKYIKQIENIYHVGERKVEKVWGQGEVYYYELTLKE